MIPQPWRRRLLFVLVAAAFVLSVTVVGRRLLRNLDGERITLRFCHWQLEPGVRDAFDALAREYERLHPNVRVEQLLIPETIFRQWTLTQLVGGSAPDLVQIGKGIGAGDGRRYFRPFTLEANEPNPYNRGTTLEHVPWRNTFIDGMYYGYDAESFECYSASLFTVSIRMFYNAELMREITGSDRPPATFTELRRLCAQVREFARRTGRDVMPVAGSAMSGSILLHTLFQSQTQRLACELNPGMDFPVDPEEFSLAYLNHRWSLEDPPLRQAAEVMRTAGQIMPPGFMELGREQANLYFVQGRALIMAGWSGELAGVLRQVKFPVRAFRCPQPAPGDPEFGAQVVARSAENSQSTYGGFGLTRASRHPEQALDFLRFLTSESSCRTYARLSQNLPVITTVEAPAVLRDFIPEHDGFPAGPAFTYLLDTNSLFQRTQHLLFGPEGNSAAFLERVSRDLGNTLRSDVERGNQNRLLGVRRTESSIAAARALQQAAPDDAVLALKYRSQIEAQNEMEAQLYYTRLKLQQAAERNPPL